MRNIISIIVLGVLIAGCKTATTGIASPPANPEFTIAFGSCNKASLPNELWDDVLAADPDIWIWGGDNIYADTDDMEKMRQMYAAQNKVPGYRAVKGKMPVIGTWDDHDYGINDGGVEFLAKKESQQQFLDFMGVSATDDLRNQEGIYTSHDYKVSNGNVKIIVLDTRYFRTALTKDTTANRNTKSNAYGEGTILGEQQWQWLENELYASEADFNIIITSIQFLSNAHGYERWDNFPHEVDALKKLLKDSKAKRVILLSGDRHISEFSREKVDGLKYPLIDFTSSGLTHAFADFKGEPNPYRVGNVIRTESFGLVHLNLGTKSAIFKSIGADGAILGELKQQY